MQIVLVGNRVVAHGEDCFLAMGGTVVCEETGRSYSNATVAEVDAIPADIDSVGYEYRAGVFAPCAPYGKGMGNVAVVCNDDCKAIKDSGVFSSDLALFKTTGKYTKITTLSEMPVGGTVSLNVNGVATDFLVVQQGNPDSGLYDEGCNGTWLLAKDVYTKMKWDATNNDYENSDVHAYLNGTFLGLLDSDVQSAIKQAKIPYVKGTGGTGSAISSGSNGLSTKVFLLSAAEIGYAGKTITGATDDGVNLAYFDGDGNNADNRMAYMDGTATDWWTRTPYGTGTTFAFAVSASSGSVVGGEVNYSTLRGIRPAFVVGAYDVSDKNLYKDDAGNIYTEQKYESFVQTVFGKEIPIPASQIVGRVQIATGSYTGTNVYGSSNKSSLTFDFEPKIVFIYRNGYKPYSVDVASVAGYFGGTNRVFYKGATSHGTYGYSGTATSGTASSATTTYTMEGNTLEWYDSRGVVLQMNSSSYTYHYVAIG